MRCLIVVLVFCALNRGVADGQIDLSITEAGGVVLRHPSSGAQQYFLEKSVDLTTWFRRGLIQPGSESLMTWNDSMAGAPRAFYRVVSGPVVPWRVFGFDFEPYVDGQDPRLHTPISRGQMEQRMRLLIPFTDWVRTYRMMDGFEAAGSVAHQLGFKVALGAWIGPESTLAGQEANQLNVANLINAALAGEADMLIVGSEVLLRNDVSAATLIGYINQVQAAVPPSIPVTTADVYSKFFQYPQVVNACDLLMANIFPFWEGESVENALTNVHRNYFNTKIVASGKEVWISEAGWPSAGQIVGSAVPSETNAAVFFQRFVSWARSNSVPFLYFEAFNETWKGTSGEGAVGPHWGVWTQNAELKPGMKPVFDNQFHPAGWNAPVSGVGTPGISFTSVPPIGSGGRYVSGVVSHVAPFDVLVSLYIKVGGNWWGPKPYSTSPYSSVSLDGGWTTLFDTGGNDINASEFAAFVFPKTYIPPAVGNSPALPATLSANALATSVASRP